MTNFQDKDLPIIFRHRILWHVLFWIVIYLGYVISYGGYGQGNYEYEAIINGALLPIRILFSYLLIYFILPKFLIKKKYPQFFIATAIHAFLFGLFIWLTFKLAIDIKGYACYEEYPIFYWNKIFVSVISNYGVPLAAMLLKLFKWWYKDQLYKNELQQEKLVNELKYLKGQIHPHFLFNTLNNLYALTLRNTGEASDVVLKLSSMLDYMLYHSNAERVPIEKELGILENYIELEKIRYGDRLKLSYEVRGDKNNIEVAPLILFPFVENAFKHGASIDRTSPEIDIFIELEANLVKVQVKNSIPKEKLIDARNKSGNGIGLKNIKRQLELLYPDKYKLDVNIEDKYYKVKLSLMCS